MAEIPLSLFKEYTDALALKGVFQEEKDIRPEVVAEAKKVYSDQKIIDDATVLTPDEIDEICRPLSVRINNFIISLIGRRIRRYD